MAIVSVPTDLATDDQIRHFGETLGVEFEPTDRRGDLLAKLAMVYTGDSIRVPEEVVRNQQGSAPRPPASAGDDPIAEALGVDTSLSTSFRDDPRVTVTIEDRENDGEIVATGGGITKARDVGVGVNGRVFQIRRGVPAQIPYRVYLALLNARRNVVSMDPNTGDTNVAEVPMYSMQVTDMPGRDEIAKWHERVDSVELA